MGSTTAIWPTGPVLLTWRRTSACDLPITGAHGFCFHVDKVLVCEIKGRGWSIPGGHMEAAETPQLCLVRELREEACAEIEQAELAGYIIADHSVNPDYTGRYPVMSALAIFAVRLKRLLAFTPSDDSLSRKLIDIDALPREHHQWDPVLDEAYADAQRKIVA